MLGLRVERTKLCARLALSAFLALMPPAAFGRTKNLKATVSLDAPAGPSRRSGSAASIKCTDKSLKTALKRFHTSMANAELRRRAPEDLERALKTSCGQLPSKYVPKELNRSFFKAVKELAQGFLAVGKSKACLEILGAHLRADSERSYVAVGFDDTDDFVAPLEKIEQECSSAFDSKHSDFRNSECPLKIAEDSVTASVGLESGAGKSCFVIAAIKKRSIASVIAERAAGDDELFECPKVDLITSGKDGTNRVVSLYPDAGPLVVRDMCCFAYGATAAVRERDGRTFIRVQGAFSDCNGNGSKGIADAIYELNGEVLKLKHDHSRLQD